MTPDILGPGETSLYVDDVDTAEDWYNEVLGLETDFGGEHYRFLKLGNHGPARQYLILFDHETTTVQEDTPPHGTADSTHLAIDVKLSDMEDWRDHFDEYGVEIEAEKNRNGDHSLYFRDPDNNSLELYGRATDAV